MCSYEYRDVQPWVERDIQRRVNLASRPSHSPPQTLWPVCLTRAGANPIARRVKLANPNLPRHITEPLGRRLIDATAVLNMPEDLA